MEVWMMSGIISVVGATGKAMITQDKIGAAMHTNGVSRAYRLVTLPIRLRVVAILMMVLGLLSSHSPTARAQGSAPAVLAQDFEPIIGTDQPLAVVVCRYNGTEAPLFNARAWAEVLNDEINRYFAAATNRLTTFQFEPVEGDCEFPYTYEETAPGGSASMFPVGVGSITDDQQVRVREVADAIAFAAQQVPGLFTRLSRIKARLQPRLRQPISPWWRMRSGIN